MVLNPFLILLEQNIQGIRIGAQRHKVTSIAYADDVTVIIRGQKEITTLQIIIAIYEKATGARINWEKTKCIPIGPWNQEQNIGRQVYDDTAKILGIEFDKTIERTIDRTWTEVMRKLTAAPKPYIHEKWTSNNE